MRPAQVAMQLAGLEQDNGYYLADEPRMREYAQTILREALATMPYARREADGYQPARWRAAGKPRLQAADIDDLDVLTERWGDALWLGSLLTVVWTVRAYHRIYATRHGRVASIHAAGFLACHDQAVEGMRHTLHGSPRPEPRFVRPWRRHA
jgi:hypothetical protein